MGKGDSPKNKWDKGVSVPGAFKLDHFQPVKRILFPNFSNFLSLILGGPIAYYPRKKEEERKQQRQKMGKGDSPENKWDKGAFKLDHLQSVKSVLLQNCSLFLPSLPFLYTERGRKREKRIRHKLILQMRTHETLLIYRLLNQQPLSFGYKVQAS